MAQKYCNKCGYKLVQESKFCPECGSRLTNDNLAETPRSMGSDNDNDTEDVETRGRERGRRRVKKQKSKFHWGCFLFMLILLAGLAVGGYYAYNFKLAKDQEKAAYMALEGCQNVEQYNDFIARFPDSRYVAVVRRRMEQLKATNTEYQSVLNSGDSRRLRRYLIENPNTRYRKIIESKLDTLEYADAIEKGTIDALQDYVDTHLNSPFLEIAMTKIKELRRTTVTAEERSRLESVAERFITSMNNGDDGGLAYIMAPGFNSFNESDTTAVNFNHDIMVYVNEQLFHEREELSLSMNDDMTANKIPLVNDNSFRYEISFTFTVGEQMEDGWISVGSSYKFSGTLTDQCQFLNISIK